MTDKAKEGAASNDVATVAAQLKAMAGQVAFLPHGSRLFTVAPGWEAKTIANDKNVAVCSTMLELQSAMRDADTSVIFIPVAAVLNEADIERVCARTIAAKTLFIERTAA